MMMQRMLLELPHWRAILSILLVKKRKQQPAIASEALPCSYHSGIFFYASTRLPGS